MNYKTRKFTIFSLAFLSLFFVGASIYLGLEMRKDQSRQDASACASGSYVCNSCGCGCSDDPSLSESHCSNDEQNACSVNSTEDNCLLVEGNNESQSCSFELQTYRRTMTSADDTCDVIENEGEARTVQNGLYCLTPALCECMRIQIGEMSLHAGNWSEVCSGNIPEDNEEDEDSENEQEEEPVHDENQIPSQEQQTRFVCDTSSYVCREENSATGFSSMEECSASCVRPEETEEEIIENLACGATCNSSTECSSGHTCSQNNVCILSACIDNPICTNSGCSIPETVPSTAISSTNLFAILFGLTFIFGGILLYKTHLFNLIGEFHTFDISSFDDDKKKEFQKKRARNQFESKFRK